MDVVADKTGYPAEMLDVSMQLEGDLGIDSIKRVEILSAMQERHPSLPEVDPAAMAGLKTLGQIVDYLGQQAGASSVSASVSSPAPVTPVPVPEPPRPVTTPPVPAAVTPPSVSEPVAEAASSMGPDLQPLLMEVVAEKTGYPAEMLDVSMQLEGDLGIDSIKRVEILSAMQERHLSLPEVDPAAMAGLKTLGQIVDYLAGQSGSAQSGAVQTTVSPAPTIPCADPGT